MDYTLKLDRLPAGKNPPKDVNVVIEIPMNSSPIKYEFDHETGAILVDRICNTPMFYPCNYGFIPSSLGGDGDPLDALVICRYPLHPFSVINCRPIGVLMMEDEKGMDEKILMLPSPKVYPYYDNVKDHNDLSPTFLLEIAHFFEHYKDLDPNKWVKVTGMEGIVEAERVILESLERFKAREVTEKKNEE